MGPYASELKCYFRCAASTPSTTIYDTVAITIQESSTANTVATVDTCKIEPDDSRCSDLTSADSFTIIKNTGNATITGTVTMLDLSYCSSVSVEFVDANNRVRGILNTTLYGVDDSYTYTFTSTTFDVGELDRYDITHINISVTNSRNVTKSTFIGEIEFVDYFLPVVGSLRVSKPDAETNSVVMQCNGTFYNGTFGVQDNTITIVRSITAPI